MIQKRFNYSEVKGKPRGKGNPVTDQERERIKVLFGLYGNKKMVAREVNRSPWIVRETLGLYRMKVKEKIHPIYFEPYDVFKNQMEAAHKEIERRDNESKLMLELEQRQKDRESKPYEFSRYYL